MHSVSFQSGGTARAAVRHSASAVAVLIWLLLPADLPAAAPDPQLTRTVRPAIFEAVLPKAKDDTLTYDRPLPLELVPFAERNDTYQSIGSAFAIGPNRFVTANHVMLAGFGNAAGPMAIRDGSGRVYPIDRVLQASSSEDYVVFTVVDPPGTVVALEPGESVSIDEVVYAAGNALGEGVVIRDGLLTSTTPEARSGRWNWLRFSAATSPGNSGGPLLDAEGRALGIVVAKSPNENLNYALPIRRVLDGDTRASSVETHILFGLPYLQDTTVVQRTNALPLPASYEAFSRGYQQLITENYGAAEKQLLDEHADKVFPRGDIAELLAEPSIGLKPSLLVQSNDRHWTLDGLPNSGTEALPGNGSVTVWSQPAASLFRIRYPDGQPTDASYRDSREMMDLLLRAMNAQRVVGAQAVRVTSLGAPVSERTHTDAFGRVWQIRIWNVAPLQVALVVYALPTPDGYVGMTLQGPPWSIGATDLQLATMTNFFTTSYSGTLAQWRGYLGRTALRAAALAKLRIANDQDGFSYASPQVELTVPGDMLKVDDQSVLNVYMGFAGQQPSIAWQPIGMQIEQARADEDYVRLLRFAQPAAQLNRDIQARWTQMTSRTADYSGEPRRDPTNGQSWFAAVKDVPGGGAVYVVRYLTQQSVSPATMDTRRDQLLESVRILAKEPR